MERINSFCAPPVILTGLGSVKGIGAQARSLGSGRVLLVADSTLARIGLADRIARLLVEADLEVELFAEVEPEPQVAVASACGFRARQGKHDLIVGLGGGSAMDVAKAGALLVTNPDPLEGYFGVEKVERPGLPTILVPTTSGTGSEVTPNIVLTQSNGKKAGIVSRHAIARAVVLDPELTVSAPPRVTAASGADALTHAVEAYVSTRATPLTDALALQAITLASQHLRRAVAEGGDLPAREGMAYASLLAGLSFANAKLGVVHAIAMALGGQFHVPHGVANALLLPYGMAFNLPAATRRMADIAQALGEDVAGLPVEQAAGRAVRAVERLVEEIGLPRTLAQVDAATDAAIESLAAEAITNQRLLATNPRPANQEDLKAILEAARGKCREEGGWEVRTR
ncbi:MAG: iron-containing alcohol dehydrogenase [Anaerolineae bacterium]